MEKENIIFGVHPVIEAINAGKAIDKLYIQRDIKGSGLTELRKAIKKAKIAFSHVPIQKLNKHTTGNHQGVMAFISPIDIADIDVGKNIGAQLQADQAEAVQKVVNELIKAKKIKMLLNSQALLAFDRSDEKINLTPEVVDLINKEQKK